MKYAEVAVNSSIARKNSFSYSIPSGLHVSIGHAVWVPFGSRTLQGIVVGLSDVPAVEETKEIISLISIDPLLSENQIKLAQWISDYYFSPLFSAINLMLPPGFGRNLLSFYRLNPDLQNNDEKNPETKEIIDLFQNKEEINEKDFINKLGKKKAKQLLTQLETEQILIKFNRLQTARVKPRMVPFINLEMDQEFLGKQLETFRKSRAAKKVAFIELLASMPNPCSLGTIRKTISCSKAVLTSLQNDGIISINFVEVRRDPLAKLNIKCQAPPVLTRSQQQAWEKVREELINVGENRKTVILLEGVTGSGKTEIYLRAIEEVIAQGKRGICLVPEIALTPQTIERFLARFPGKVAVYHSGLTIGEQYDEWHRIRNQESSIVIGPRSALFVPQSNLGLIIVDEEHEWTYKQTEASPRYHSRESAIKLAQLSGATVLLGSATPDIVSYYKSLHNDYTLIKLPERITPRGIVPLPEVEVINMGDELKSGNNSIFSRSLNQAMRETLDNHQQVILFLNRRGSATLVQCLDCGYIITCKRCLTALTYHQSNKKLVCHHCNYSISIPRRCPQCHKDRITLFGMGTEKVEEETQKLFPQARIKRWDRDATIRRGAHQELLNAFLDRKADILIGTQMIAKGLDMPSVTLAGVINADTSLTIPDFRSSERTFQLLCQIAGRAGRGLSAGKVIIQTFSPNQYAIKAASKQDYSGFYAQEIEYRKQFGYPPFSRLIRLVYSHAKMDNCRAEAAGMMKILVAERYRKGLLNERFIGPVPAPVPRIRGQYRWQIIICGRNPNDIIRDVAFPKGWILDIDPVGMV